MPQISTQRKGEGTVQKVAQGSSFIGVGVLSYRKSDEAGGTAVDENTSPPILP